MEKYEPINSALKNVIKCAFQPKISGIVLFLSTKKLPTDSLLVVLGPFDFEKNNNDKIRIPDKIITPLEIENGIVNLALRFISFSMNTLVVDDVSDVVFNNDNDAAVVVDLLSVVVIIEVFVGTGFSTWILPVINGWTTSGPNIVPIE